MKSALYIAGAIVMLSAPAFAQSSVTIEKQTITRQSPDGDSTVTVEKHKRAGTTEWYGSSEESSEVIAPIAPPPPRAEAPPPPPGPDVSWVPGHWRWNSPGRTFVWVDGDYRRPPELHASWVSGHWAQGPGGWEWHDGHWD